MEKNKCQKMIREENARKILKLLVSEGQLSRISIAEKTGLSPSTVTQIITPLLQENVVEEYKEEKSTGGRKPVLLRLSKDYGHILIFEVTNIGINAYHYNLHKELTGSAAVHKSSLSGQDLYKCIVKYVGGLQQEEEIPVIQIGILIQEDLNKNAGVVMFSSEYGSEPYSLEYAVSNRLKIPVVKNTMKSISFEHYVNKEMDALYESYGYLTIGNSVTASITMNRKKVEIAGETSFDVTPLLTEDVLIHNVKMHMDERIDGVHAVETIKEPEKETDSQNQILMLARVINILYVLFPVKILFLGGEGNRISEKDVKKLSAIFDGKLKVKKWESKKTGVTDQFAQKLLENFIPNIVIKTSIC